MHATSAATLPQDNSTFQKRRDALRPILEREKLSALLVTLDANRYYLSGFELKDPQTDESSGCLIITAQGNDWLCTDSRYHEAACRVWDAEKVFIYRGAPAVQIGELLRKNISGPIGFDARHISVDFHQALACPSLCKADALVEQLRVLKEPGEITIMAASCAINEKMMTWLPTQLLPGKTEKQVAWEIEQFFRNNGAEGLAFASIVAVNGNAALPHAEPGDTPITENCSVLVDVGCRFNAYCSDQTRTFWVGDKPDPFFLENLRYVQEAQQKAIQSIKPGVTGSQVYKAALDSLKAAGVSEYFTHGLGHGVGLQTHENPRLAPSINYPLEPGMVVTVEPGVYYSGRLGIRWEHMVVVTEDGYKVL